MIGREVLDRKGEHIGKVLDTLPLDGGGEVELLLVNVGRRFPRRKLVPAEGLRVQDGGLRLAVSRIEIEDCPSAEDRRWGDPADIARGYWLFATD